MSEEGKLTDKTYHAITPSQPFETKISLSSPSQSNHHVNHYHFITNLFQEYSLFFNVPWIVLVRWALWSLVLIPRPPLDSAGTCVGTERSPEYFQIIVPCPPRSGRSLLLTVPSNALSGSSSPEITKLI